MLSDEEKEAIEWLKSRLYGNEGCKFIDVAQSDLRILLNLIENQSNEIEELKKYEKYYEEMEEVNKKFLPVAKIKAKIEELKQKKYILSSRESEIEILQSLLEEEE